VVVSGKYREEASMSARENKTTLRRFVDEVQSGDNVATHKTFHGTHQGELMGIPPTGQQVSIGLIDIVRTADGQVVEYWSMVDNLGMMQQLGVIPGSRQSGASGPSEPL